MKLFKKSLLCALAVSAIGLGGTSCAKKSFVVKFDSTKEVSGKKFAVKDINPELPTDWSEYKFVILDFKLSTSQDFLIGFNAGTGYNELRINTYCGNGRNSIAIPMEYFALPPGSAQDMAATYNKKRFTGWVHIHNGDRIPLNNIDSVGFRMLHPIGNQELEVYNITLAMEDPGDKYLEEVPMVDEFGQWNLGTWDGKATSVEQLEQVWRAEEAALENVTTEAYNYSKFGGYLNAKIDEGTGFFRTKLVDGKWWFVDPEGYAFLSMGVDCVSPGGGLNARDLDKRANLYKELPPEELWKSSNPDRPGTPSFGQWNLVRRFGQENYRQKSNELIIKRMDKWGQNTIANWSSGDVIALGKKPFMIQLGGMGIGKAFMGLVDVYAPEFEKNIDEACQKSTARYKDNPYLIGYFSGNEPPWGHRENQLCDLILAADDATPLKVALKEYIAQNGDSEDSRRKFVIKTFRTFLETVDKYLKKHDPNHMNIGIRFGADATDEILEACKGMFDVFSFNSYSLTPSKEYMDKVMKITGLPMVIGEYHFGTVGRGMSAALWIVDSQKERGDAYRYYTEQGLSHPGLIGVAYFQWNDQDLTGRNGDGENLNCGIVDVTDRPYEEQVAAMSETAKVAYEVHNGTKPAFGQVPPRIRARGAVPNIWNK